MSCRDALLWVTDPWETLDHPRDTTLRLMEECGALGVPCFWSDVTSVLWTPAGTRLQAYEVRHVDHAREADSFRLEDRGLVSPASFRLLAYRPDPPVDLAYLHPLQLLVGELERKSQDESVAHTELVNPARVLLSCGEKTEASSIDGLMAPSVVAARWEALEAFGRAEGSTVAKPLHQAQSKGVQLLDWGDAACRLACKRVLDEMTAGFRRPVMLQRYLREVLEGETRVWLLDGEAVATARKTPARGTFCIDMDKGGELCRHTLTEPERRAMRLLRPHLARRGIRLAAVDMIAGWVTDFNFTSPGLLPAMEAIEGRNLARLVVEGLSAVPNTHLGKSGNSTQPKSKWTAETSRIVAVNPWDDSIRPSPTHVRRSEEGEPRRTSTGQR